MNPARIQRSSAPAESVSARPLASGDSRQLLFPLVLAFLLALILAWPARLAGAQEPVGVTATSSGTHTVKVGETLWSLAARYYGDGHRWRDLAQLNGLAEGGEKAISVGQVLRVPGNTPPMAVSRAAMATPPAAGVPDHAKAPAAKSTPSQAEEKTVSQSENRSIEPEPASPPEIVVERLAEAESVRSSRIGLVRQTQISAARGRDNATIFLGPAPFNADTMQGTIDLDGDESFVSPAGKRIAEYEAAPYTTIAGNSPAARVKGRLDAGGNSLGRIPQRMQQKDLIELAFPKDVDLPRSGEKLVTVRKGSGIKGANLVIPTGVVVVEAVDEGRVTARVSKLYGVIEENQEIVKWSTAPDAPEESPVSQIETEVIWISEAPLLPSLQTYLILKSLDGQDVIPGDRFELLTPGASQNRIGLVRVVRTNEKGISAIITQQSQAGIQPGTVARRVSRQP